MDYASAIATYRQELQRAIQNPQDRAHLPELLASVRRTLAERSDDPLQVAELEELARQMTELAASPPPLMFYGSSARDLR